MLLSLKAVRLSIQLKSEKQLTFTLSHVPKMMWGHAVLIAATAEQTGGKWDGFCSPVSSNLSPVSLSEMLVHVINSWLDETPPFSDPSLNLTEAITKPPSGIKSRSVRKVTRRLPPWALQGPRPGQAISLQMALTRPDPDLTHRPTSQPSLGLSPSLSPGRCLMTRVAPVPSSCPASGYLFNKFRH